MKKPDDGESATCFLRASLVIEHLLSIHREDTIVVKPFWLQVTLKVPTSAILKKGRKLLEEYLLVLGNWTTATNMASQGTRHRIRGVIKDRLPSTLPHSFIGH